MPEAAATQPHDLSGIGPRRAVVDVAVQVVGRIGNLAMGIAVTLILVHALGARGFGEWSTILAITQIASNFGDLGLSQVAVVRAVAEPEREGGWMGALLSLRLVLSVPIALASLLGVLIIVPGGPARLAGVLLCSILIIGAASCLTSVFQIRVRNDVSIAIMTFNSAIWLLGAVLVSSQGRGITGFAIAFVIVNVLTTGIIVLTAIRWIRLRLAGSPRRWGPLLRVGVGVGIGGILVTMYVRLDQILVFQIAGSRQAGLYGAAYRVLDQAQFIPASVMTTLFPLIAAAYPRDAPRVRRLLQLAMEYLCLGSFGALAFTIVAARPIMVLLFGPQFAAAAPALPILMGAFCSISVGYLIGNMVVILRLQRYFVRIAAVGLLLNVVLNLALIPPFGFKAAAWVTLATELTVMTTTAANVLRRLRMRPTWGRVGREAAAAAGMGVLAFAARRAGVPIGWLIPLAAAGYAALLVLFRAFGPRDIAVLLRRQPVQ